MPLVAIRVFPPFIRNTGREIKGEECTRHRRWSDSVNQWLGLESWTDPTREGIDADDGEPATHVEAYGEVGMRMKGSES